jgi:chromate reductase
MKQQINDIDMKKILIIGASSHVQSVNKQFATYAGSKVGASDLTVLDLNDFEMEIFSQDRESATGIPEKAKAFVRAVESADGIILSLAEHNGSYTAAFKNVLDWASRSKQNFGHKNPCCYSPPLPDPGVGQMCWHRLKAIFHTWVLR